MAPLVVQHDRHRQFATLSLLDGLTLISFYYPVPYIFFFILTFIFVVVAAVVVCLSSFLYSYLIGVEEQGRRLVRACIIRLEGRASHDRSELPSPTVRPTLRDARSDAERIGDTPNCRACENNNKRQTNKKKKHAPKNVKNVVKSIVSVFLFCWSRLTLLDPAPLAGHSQHTTG